MADTIGKANLFLYRGYCCDAETGLYSLNSRYYDPQTGRFLNADGQFNPETGLAGNNIFAYCNNDPTGLADNGGSRPMAMSENGIESIEDQIIAAKFNSEAHRKTALAAATRLSASIDTKSPPPPSSGYKPPKKRNKAKQKVPAPGARGKTGWLDNKGRVWVPDNAMDGGPGWRRHYKDGSHDHVYPNGKVRTHNILTEEYYWDFPGSFSDQVSTTTGFTGTALIIYIIISEGSRIIPVRNLVPVP